MKFKLNNLEKFAIKHYNLFVLLFFAVLVVYAVIFYNFENNSDYSIFQFSVATLIFMVVAFPIAFLMGVFPRKLKEINRISDVDMDMYGCIDACNQMLAIIKPKNVTYVSNLCIKRICCFINLGDLEAAENEIRLFWQHMNLKKVPASSLAATHILMAEIALIREDYQMLNEEMRLVNEYGSNSEMVGMFKKAYNFNLTEINLAIEAHCANANSNGPDYEARVFAQLNIDSTKMKPRKKPAEPHHLISAYNNLFVFYKKARNTEKARFFAAQIANIGNEQLRSYRNAKEYLDNENRSN